MKREQKEVLYTSPKAKIVEIKARQVLCQSGVGGGINNMEIEDGEVI